MEMPMGWILTAMMALGSCSAKLYQVRIDTVWRTPVGREVRWAMPRGVVRFHEDGTIGLVKFREGVNAALELAKFGGEVRARSNQRDAGKVVDGREDTWWSPDPRDPIEDWMIELDLGKAILARKIKLTFADTVVSGDTLKPFERFKVYISNGTGRDWNVPEYRLLGRTEEINRERCIEYIVRYEEAGDTTEAGETLKKVLNLDLVRFVRIMIEAPNISGRPALAEVEVGAVGDNIAFLTNENGGNIKAYINEDKAPNIFDGHAGRGWEFQPVPDVEWCRHPTNPNIASCFEWDLGATFWVDRMYLDFGRQSGVYASVGLDNITRMPSGYILMVSDGSPRPGGPLDWPPGNKYDYKLLADVENRSMPYQLHYFHEFEPMKVRHIFFRTAHGFMTWGRGEAHLFEMQIFGEGYPAEATFESGPVGLAWLTGGKGDRLVTTLMWKADQPSYPETRVEVQTRTGDVVDTVWTYYKKIGKRLKEVTREEYLRLPERLRHKEFKDIKPGTGWSDWSSLYPQEGPFLSPSPCRYVQFRVKLVTERRDVAPTFKGLWIDVTEPLVKEAIGSLEPREVSEVDTALGYTYKIWTEARPQDKGFKNVLIRGPVVEDTVKLNGRPLDPSSVDFGRDSLSVKLPRLIKGDSLEIWFRARVSKNRTTFRAFLGLSGVWQEVRPAEPGATSVLIPVLAETERLVWNLRVTPLITPNGDGFRDKADITFSLLKVEGREPEVRIYDIGGHLVKELEKEGNWRYSWDGKDSSGDPVPPGIYICEVSVKTDSGCRTVARTIGVVY